MFRQVKGQTAKVSKGKKLKIFRKVQEDVRTIYKGMKDENIFLKNQRCPGKVQEKESKRDSFSYSRLFLGLSEVSWGETRGALRVFINFKCILWLLSLSI